MLRLFIGLPLPAEVRRLLSSLAAGIPQARWTTADNLHVTVRFIGEVDEPTAEAVDAALGTIRAPAFDLTVAGCGTFDSRNQAHTLWAGVERSPALVRLRDKVESSLVRAGLAPERRRFRPHVTLARLKAAPTARLQDFIAAHNLLRATVRADAFVLYSSQLAHGDPVYTALATYPLGEGQDQAHSRSITSHSM
jgi:2'-5' RNA ligase